MSLANKKPILLCIDIQLGFQEQGYWGTQRNNPDAEKVCADILMQWRKRGLEVVHIRHSSLTPRSPLQCDHAGFAFHPLAQPMVRLPNLWKESV